MKVILRAHSEDFGLENQAHMIKAQRLEDMAYPVRVRAVSMQEEWCMCPSEFEMQADQNYHWLSLQQIEVHPDATFGPNPGSLLHGIGSCSPCAWYWKPRTCLNGMACHFCHLCPDGELKLRRKAKVAAIRSGLTPKAHRNFQPTEAGEETPQNVGHVLSLSSLL
jgi:hypothetical protein